jgi:hypothetical protein
MMVVQRVKRNQKSRSPSIDYTVAPLRSFNLATDDRTHFSVKVNQLGVDGMDGPLACASYQSNDLREDFFVLSYWLEIRRISIIWFHMYAFQSQTTESALNPG